MNRVSQAAQEIEKLIADATAQNRRFRRAFGYQQRQDSDHRPSTKTRRDPKQDQKRKSAREQKRNEARNRRTRKQARQKRQGRAARK